MNGFETALVLWFSATAAAVAFVAYDLLTSTPVLPVMKLGWVLVTLYTGPVGLLVYLLACRAAGPSQHEARISPLWRQAIGSTIHCLAGDATGVLLAATITASLRLPMGRDLLVEYASGFLCGLLIFQALFMKDVLGGSYVHAIRRTILPEWLSMNAVMAGMVPTMVLLMSRDPAAGDPTSLRFWGTMSLATLVGAILAYPVNYWLVRVHLKHGMGTERALGRGGQSVTMDARAMSQPHVPGAAVVGVALISLALLAGGILVAAGLGDLTLGAALSQSPIARLLLPGLVRP